MDKFCVSYDASILTSSSGLCTKISLTFLSSAATSSQATTFVSHLQGSSYKIRQMFPTCLISFISYFINLLYPQLPV